MDIVAENFESDALPKVSVEDASGDPKMHQGIAATSSLMQASFLPFSGSSFVNKSPSPVQTDPKQSLAFHVPIIPSTNATPTAALDARAADEVAVTSVEGPSTVVSSAPSSLPNDTTGFVVTPSSSCVLDFSSAEPAPGIALMAPSIFSSQVATIPTYSPSLTTSVPLVMSTPYSCWHRIQVPSGTTLTASDARSESLGCSPAAGAPQPAVMTPSSGVVGPNSSGPVLTPLPTSLAPAEVPVSHSEISSSQAADRTLKEEIPAFPAIVLERQHQQRPSTVLPFSSSTTDNKKTIASPMSTTSLRSESKLGAPCFSTSALPSPSESNLEISPSTAPLALPDVGETDTMDLSPVGASTGLLSEHERTSLGTSTSFPASETLPRRPVRGGQQGEGWPYAPQEWPEPDDKWTWRVGKRVHVNGYFRDRFLALPKSLCKGRKTTEFASKKSVVEYLKENFPDLSVENFFKSFQWRIPSYVNSWHSFSPSASKVNALKRQRPAEGDSDVPSLPKRSKQECKAGNPSCGLETGRSILLGGHSVLACDICCTEPGFCRECKCILCCKTIEPDFLESTFVRCMRKPSGNSVCGHAAHLECALHSKMAGVVKNRGLDMEYLCRRCDKRTDLRELVPLLLEAVGSTELRTQAEKSLELALEVMNGTERGGSGARILDALVQTALRKVINGVDIQEVFKELKEQGAAAAAEAARQQNLGRSSCLMEDASQQPEASLDQWLPSSGSPSSHPSPGAPSFTSPRLRSNPSVTSGQIHGGIQTVEDSLRKHRAVGGHTDHSGEPQTCNEGVSNSKYKNSHLGNKSLIRNAGQVRKSHSNHAVSSSVNGLEAICDSFTTGTPGNVAEPGSRDGNSSQRANQNSNSGTKNLKDLRNPFSGAGKLREENEMCKSVACTLRHHTSNAVETTSTLKSPKIEDGGKKVVKSSLTPGEDEQGDCDAYKQVAESDTGVDANGRSHKPCTTNGSGHKSMATTLQMLDRHCEQEMRFALQKLRRAQEAEFHRAEACLTAKKKSVLKKHELLEATRREFSEQPVSISLEAFDELLIRTGNQFAGAKEERDNFQIMLKVADGFGCVSKDDLKKFYRWPTEN